MKKDNNNLTIYVPLYKMGEGENKKYLKRCVESIYAQTDNVCLLGTKQDFEDIRDISWGNFDPPLKIVTGEKTSYQAKFNIAIRDCGTKYFMVMEFDDILVNGYLKSFAEHENKMDCDAYVGIIRDMNTSNEFISLKNNMFWQYGQVSGELGYYSMETLEKMPIYSLVGGIYKKSSIENILMKENIEMYFDYEYVLRLLSKGKKIYVIPKISVGHTNLREGSFYEEKSKTMNKLDLSHWMKIAKQEYYFDEDKIHRKMDE